MRNREQAGQELTNAAHSSRKSRRDHIQQYQQWCAHNNITELPTDTDNPHGDRILRVYLHTMHLTRNWSHNTVKEAASAVAHHYTQHGRTDPRGPLTTAWRKAHARNNPPNPENKADTLTLTEVKRAATTWLTPTPDETALYALIAVAHCSSDTSYPLNPFTRKEHQQLRNIHANNITVTPSHATVTVADSTILIDAERNPKQYAAVRAAAQSTDQHPLAATSHIYNATRRLHRALRATRPDLELPPEQWWETADAESRSKLARNTSHSRVRKIQDSALLLTAVLNLLRAAEISRLTIGHMRPRPDGSGYDFTLTQHKGTELAEHHGRRAPAKHGSVDHQRPDAHACETPCPACTLQQHITLRRDTGATDTDPLFVSYNATTLGQVIGVGGVRAVMRRAAHTPEGPDGQKRNITARSARVTGATELRNSGATYSELQEAGAWQSARTAQLYVRSPKAPDASLTHSLESDQEPTTKT